MEETFNNTYNLVKTKLDDNTKWMEDSNTANILTFAIVIYAVLFVGKISPNLTLSFKHPLVKLLAFLTVAYISSKNTSLALVATIAIIIIMMTNLKNTNEFFTLQSPMELDIYYKYPYINPTVQQIEERRMHPNYSSGDVIDSINFNNTDFRQNKVNKVKQNQPSEQQTISYKEMIEEEGKQILNNVLLEASLTHENELHNQTLEFVGGCEKPTQSKKVKFIDGNLENDSNFANAEL